MHNTFKQYLFLIFICIGSLNIAAIASEQDTVIEAPQFSHASGFYPEEFTLKITHSDPSAKIYYTLDGSTPDPNNLKGSTFKYKNHYAQPPNKPSGELLEMEYRTYPYVKPLHIKDRTFEPDRISQISTTLDPKPKYLPKPTGILKKKYLYKGTPVRAIAIQNERKSTIAEGIFFIGDRAQFTLPIINITVPEKALFDYEEGIFVAGKDYDDWLIGKLEGDYAATANWGRRGVDTQAYLYFIDGNGTVEAPVDIRTHGGWTRTTRNKSIRIYPRKEYTPKGIEYDIFNDGSILGFSRIILRNAGNAVSRDYMVDAVLQRAFTDLNFGTQRYRPAVTFINGEYNGVLNIRDRQDHYNLQALYNIPNRKVDILKNNRSVKRGDAEHWHLFEKFIREESSTSPTFFKGLKQQIDLKSYIDYYAAQIYIANTDWPGNNIRWWRYKGDNKEPMTATGYTDGRWRWLMYDVDGAGRGAGNIPDKGKYDFNMLQFATAENGPEWPNPEWSTSILRKVLQNPEFRELFITRFSDLLNSTFRSKRIIAIIREAEAAIAAEMPQQVARWKEPKSMRRWYKSINRLASFFYKRPKYQWQHLEEFFNLEGRYQVNVAMALADATPKEGENLGRIQLNTLTLGEPKPQNPDVTYTNLALPWQGDYFKNLPLVVEAIPAEGYQFSHWEVEGITLTDEEKHSPKLVLKPAKNLRLRAIMDEE